MGYLWGCRSWCSTRQGQTSEFSQVTSTSKRDGIHWTHNKDSRKHNFFYLGVKERDLWVCATFSNGSRILVLIGSSSIIGLTVSTSRVTAAATAPRFRYLKDMKRKYERRAVLVWLSSKTNISLPFLFNSRAISKSYPVLNIGPVFECLDYS